MPITVLNGVLPKRSRLTPRNGTVLHSGIAASQHGTTAIGGTSYNSPFTASGKPLFNQTNDNTQQIQTIPLKVESAGDVIPAQQMVKVHPWEKGSHFATVKPARPIVGRVGGPSNTADTPANPNAPHLKKQPRPKLMPSGGGHIASKTSQPSFLRSGGTIGGHPDQQAGTSTWKSRWSVTKTGAAG